MFFLLDLRFVLCSHDLNVLRAQRIMGSYILITHKAMRWEIQSHGYYNIVVLTVHFSLEMPIIFSHE